MPGAESDGTNPFGAELKAQRLKRGWTQVEVAEKLAYSSSFISDVELGNRNPRSDFAAKCDEVFGSPGTFGRLHDVVRHAAYPSFFAPVIPYEASAVRIHGWELGSVPGLLQTEEYARALISATRPQDDDAAIDRLVTARMERQEILSGESPPKVWYILDESVLRRVVGSAEVMAGQLGKLVGSAISPGIVIQVLPFTAGDQPGTDGPTVLYEFPDRPAVIYAECNRGGRLVEEPGEVAEMTTTLHALRASALSPRATLALLRRLRRDRDGLEEEQLQRRPRRQLRGDRQRQGQRLRPRHRQPRRRHPSVPGRGMGPVHGRDQELRRLRLPRAVRPCHAQITDSQPVEYLL